MRVFLCVYRAIHPTKEIWSESSQHILHRSCKKDPGKTGFETLVMSIYGKSSYFLWWHMADLVQCPGISMSPPTPRRVSPGFILGPVITGTNSTGSLQRDHRWNEIASMCMPRPKLWFGSAVGRCYCPRLWQWFSLNQGNYEWNPNPSI